MSKHTTLISLTFVFLQATFAWAGDDISAKDRLKSCNPTISLGAAEEILRNPESLKEPLELFAPAAVLFQRGKKDKGIFWFYAAQLRTRYQLVFEKGDRGQLLSIMLMTVGAPINNYAFQNTSNFRRILDQVLEWDKTTPNPYREKPRSEIAEQQIAAIYGGLRDLQAKLSAEQSDIEANARRAAPEIERMFAAGDNPQCRAGQVDPANAAQEIIKEKVLVKAYVENNPEVIRDAGEIKSTWFDRVTTMGTDTMPFQYEMGVMSAAGKESHAIVDVSRSGADVKFKLVCIARLRWVSRDTAKDPCIQ